MKDKILGKPKIVRNLEYLLFRNWNNNFNELIK